MLHIAASLVAGWIIQFQPHDDRWNWLVLGICSGQSSVAAAGLALGPYRLLTRLSIALLILGLACLPILAVAVSLGVLEIALAIDGALLAQFALIQLPLWFLRLRRGWRLGMSCESPRLDDKPTQFGIRQLFLWTGGVGCFLGVARLLMPTDTRISLDISNVGMVTVMFLLLTAFHTLLALPLIGSALARRQALLTVPVALVFVGLLSWIEPWMFRLLLPYYIVGDESPFWLLNGAHVSWLLGSLLIVRICGYRLHPLAAEAKTARA